MDIEVATVQEKILHDNISKIVVYSCLMRSFFDVGT